MFYRPAIRKKTCRYCGEDFYANRADVQFLGWLVKIKLLLPTKKTKALKELTFRAL
jgi:hypothetical protein